MILDSNLIMQINIAKLPKSQIQIQIELLPQEWESNLDKAAAELSKNLNIQGFRPGKAPRGLVEEKIGSQKIYEEAAQMAIRETYVKIIMEKNLEILGQPKIEILKLAIGNPLVFKATAAIMPEIKIGPYRKISQEIKNKKVSVDEKEIEDALKWLQNSRAKLITVKRPAENGDRVEIDFKAKIAGVPIEDGESKNHPFILGDGKFISGFEDQLAGMKENEEKLFSVIAPKDWRQKNLAGKKIDFEVKMKLVQERQLPELDDDFAKSLGNFNDIVSLGKSMEEGLFKEKEIKEKERWRVEAIEKIASESSVEVPEILIEKEKDKIFQELKSSLENMGLDFKHYLEHLKKTEEDLRKDWQSQAERRVKIALALRKIAEEEKIEASPEEIENKANEILKQYPDIDKAKKQIDPGYLKEYAESIVKNEKVFELLESYHR